MAEKPDAALGAFYERLLAALRRPEAHDGVWRLSACRAAWGGNPTWDNFVVFSWQGARKSGKEGGDLLVAVNYGPTEGQCYAEVGLSGLGDGVLVLSDLTGEARYERDGRTLGREGLYLDLPPWGYNVFDVRPRSS